MVCFVYNKFRLFSLNSQKEGLLIKRKDKNTQSKNKILQAALAEFGSKDYSKASINNICNDNNLSKGLIYYYFKNKDELFLLCTKKCFDELGCYLEDNVEIYQDNVENSIENYFIARHNFFEENKEFKQIFYDAVFQPPEHLKKEIAELKEGFDAANKIFLKKILRQLKLRDMLSVDEAIEYFILFQDFFNSYFQKNQFKDNHVSEVIKTHEIRSHKVFDIILYGIAKQEGK